MKPRPVVDVRALVAALESDPELAARVGRAIAPHVFAAGMVAASRPSGSFSTRRGHHPPGYAAETWLAIAKRIGVKRGRWYFVSSEALARYEEGESDTAHSKPANDPAPSTTAAPKWHPADTLPSVRRRLVGGGAP